jgi:hypothetical protein
MAGEVSACEQEEPRASGTIGSLLRSPEPSGHMLEVAELSVSVPDSRHASVIARYLSLATTSRANSGGSWQSMTLVCGGRPIKWTLCGLEQGVWKSRV